MTPNENNLNITFRDLQHNVINDIHPDAFIPLYSLEDL